MAALDNIASELLKSANEADLIFKKTRDQAQRDKAVRLRRIVENLKAISADGLTPTLDEVLAEGNVSTNSLNVGGITTDYVQLDTTATPTLAPGMFAWNDAYGTADLRLKGNNVTLQLGQETLARVVNKTGSDLLESEYRVVRVRVASEGGAQGQRLAVVLAQGLNDPESATTLGIVTETILNNQEGFITVFGNVNNINTTGSLQGETWVDGDVLYLSPTTPGALTKVKPVAPQHMVIMGYVVYAHANQGKIFVKVDNGYELDELHNVLITSPANNDLLQYNSTQQVWKNVASSVAVPTPTLAQVTTAGNTTTNAITVGNITVNSSTNELKIFDVTGGNYTRIKDRTIAFSRNNGTSESVSIYSPDNQLWLRARSGIYIYSGVNPGETYFFAKDYSGTNRIQVKDTGAVILQESNNNVLIGTTTDAGYKLDVNGTARINNNLILTNSTYAGTFTFRIAAANTLIGNSVNIGDWLQVGGGNRVYILGQEFNSTSRGNIFGNTVGGEAVGIANIIAQSSGTTDLFGLRIRYAINNTGTYSGIVRGIYYNPTLTSLTGTTHRAIETVSGDVVFGSTSGSVVVAATSVTNMLYGEVPKLYVNGGSYLNGTVQLGTSSIRVSGNNISWESTGITNNLPEWRADATGVKFGNYLSLPLRISVNGVENARFFSTGNVAIGTTTDAGYKLDVNGTGRFSGQVKFDNSNIIATGITSQVANFQIARANTNTSVEIIGGATSVKFDSTSASASTQFAGKVAIGSAYFTPTEMLHVDGSIKSSALTLNGPVLATGGVLSSIAGYTGLFTVPTNPPGMQTLDIQNGIIVNVL